MAKKKKRKSKKDKRAQSLVCQHLENISRNALEQYLDIIQQYIRGMHGIYVLYRRKKLYYIGLARNLRPRLRAHLRDKHKNSWDSFSAYLTVENYHMKELESLLLRIANPVGNSVRGKFVHSENLNRRFKRDITVRKKAEIDALFGGGKKVKKIRRKKKRKLGPEDGDLAMYVDQPMRIRAVYKGEIYKARVRRDGWIRYQGYLYRTPTAAAREIVGRNYNGWKFWKYEQVAGRWVPLAKLR